MDLQNIVFHMHRAVWPRGAGPLFHVGDKGGGGVPTEETSIIDQDSVVSRPDPTRHFKFAENGCVATLAPGSENPGIVPVQPEHSGLRDLTQHHLEVNRTVAMYDLDSPIVPKSPSRPAREPRM